MLPFLSRNLLHNVRASWLTEQSLSAAPRFEQLTTEQVVLLRAAALRRADYPDDFDLMARFAPSSRGKQTAHELPLHSELGSRREHISRGKPHRHDKASIMMGGHQEVTWVDATQREVNSPTAFAGSQNRDTGNYALILQGYPKIF